MLQAAAVLTKLDLSDNPGLGAHITGQLLGSCPSVRHLALSGCGIDAWPLPEAAGCLQQLATLQLRGNPLPIIPQGGGAFAACISLRELDLSGAAWPPVSCRRAAGQGPAAGPSAPSLCGLTSAVAPPPPLPRSRAPQACQLPGSFPLPSQRSCHSWRRCTWPPAAWPSSQRRCWWVANPALSGCMQHSSADSRGRV